MTAPAQVVVAKAGVAMRCTRPTVKSCRHGMQQSTTLARPRRQVLLAVAGGGDPNPKTDSEGGKPEEDLGIGLEDSQVLLSHDYRSMDIDAEGSMDTDDLAKQRPGEGVPGKQPRSLAELSHDYSVVEGLPEEIYEEHD